MYKKCNDTSKTYVCEYERKLDSFSAIKRVDHIPGACFSKVPKRFVPEKPVVKLRPAYSVKLVFSYVVKGIKIKITAKFRASRRLRFEDTKRIVSPEIRPKSFRTFEKQAPGYLSELWRALSR